MKIKIKEKIEESQKTQKEIAMEIQTSQASISGWISGKKDIKLQNAYKLSKVLNCKIEDFIEDEEYGSPPPEKKEVISKDETELIHYYRDLDENQKKLIFEVAKSILLIYNNKSADKHGRD